MSELKVDKVSSRTGGYLALNTLSHKNIIINGDMSVAQRGTSESSVSSINGYNTVDRMILRVNGIGTWTMSQDTDTPTGQGFANSFKMDCTAATASPTAGATLMFRQRIEGQNLQYLKKGTSTAESVTLSFWVKSNKTGTYTAEIVDVDNNRSISKTYTIDSASTWEKKTITFAGDTTGTLDNDNAYSFELVLWLGAGSDFTSGTLNTSWNTVVNANRVSSSQVNLADNTANDWAMTGVQLEANTTATSYNFEPFDVNLARCQRYFQKSYNTTVDPGTSTNTGMTSTARIQNTVSNRPVNVHFRPIMRTTPTVTVYSLVGTQGSVSDTGTSAGTHSRDEAVNVSQVGASGMAYLTGVGGLTAGDGMCFHYTADAEL